MRKKHLRVIQMIQEGIPRELLMNLTKMEQQGATIRKVYEIALTKPDDEITPRQKRNIQAMLDSGRLDKEVEVLDEAVEKQIDEYMREEIDKAVKLGRLPKQAPVLKSLSKKGIQYAKRQERRLRREFGVKSDDVAETPEDDSNIQSGDQTGQANNGGLPSFSGAAIWWQAKARWCHA